MSGSPGARIGFGLVMTLAVIASVGLLTVLPWWMLVIGVVALAAWMALTRIGQQSWSVTEVGIATIPQRLEIGRASCRERV